MGLRRTEAVERRDEHHVALPQGQKFGPRCYSWPCPGCSSLFPGFFCLRSGNLARPHLLGELWGWQLSPPASVSVLEAEPSPEPRGRCSQAGFWLGLYSWQGRASDFHSAWVGCEQGLWHFGRLSPAATGDLGNLGRNIAISASVSQPHRPVAQGAAASCSLGVGRAAASRGFVLCRALKVMQSRSPRSIIYLWAKGEARGLLQLRALIHEEPAASLLLEKGATLGWEGKSCPPS